MGLVLWDESWLRIPGMENLGSGSLICMYGIIGDDTGYRYLMIHFSKP